MSSPADGATVTGVVDVRLSVSTGSSIAKVRFYVDGRPVSLDYRTPFSFSWNTVRLLPGSVHAVTGVAYDGRGREVGRIRL